MADALPFAATADCSTAVARLSQTTINNKRHQQTIIIIMLYLSSAGTKYQVLI